MNVLQRGVRSVLRKPIKSIILASPAKVLLADEPTGNLDEEIADEIIKILMKSAHEMGKSVIVVTHSKKIADAADVVLKIHEGKLYHLV